MRQSILLEASMTTFCHCHLHNIVICTNFSNFQLKPAFIVGFDYLFWICIFFCVFTTEFSFQLKLILYLWKCKNRKYFCEILFSLVQKLLNQNDDLIPSNLIWNLSIWNILLIKFKSTFLQQFSLFWNEPKNIWLKICQSNQFSDMCFCYLQSKWRFKSEMDPGKWKSDGSVKRNRRRKLNGDESIINQVTDIKDEPVGETCLVERWTQSPPIEASNLIKLGSESSMDKSSKDQNGDVRAGENQCNIKANSNNNRKTKPRNSNKRKNKEASMKRETKAQAKIYNCHSCSYKTSIKRNLMKHLPVHDAGRPFQCNLCEKYFAHKRSLKYHQRIHRKQFTFHCSRCQCGFTQEIVNINHENQCRIRQFECYLCKYSTMKIGQLKTHIRFRHIGDKPFDCRICSNMSVLRFDCSKCGQRFADDNERQLHEGRNKGRRYECQRCPKKQWNKSQLKKTYAHNAHWKKTILKRMNPQILISRIIFHQTFIKFFHDASF